MSLRILGWSALFALGMFLLFATQASADNCGSLPDCWQTAAAAAAAAAGAGAAAGLAGRGDDDDDCKVGGLTPITDPHAQSMEDGKKIQWEGTAEGLQDAANCLIAAIKAAGGTASINSAYRSQAYQDHLREIWDKARELEMGSGGACDDVRAEVFAELKGHKLKTTRPVAKHSRHTSGRAVDMDWSLPGGDAGIDALAAGCGLTHQVPNDRPHFEMPKTNT